MGITTKDKSVTATSFKEMLTTIETIYSLGLAVDNCHYAVNRITLRGEGFVHVVTTPRGMFDKLNSMGAMINSTKSRLNGSVWMLEFNSEVESKLSEIKSKTSVPTDNTKELVTEEPVEEIVNEDIQETQEEDLQESAETGTSETETTQEVVVESVDLEYAAGLYDESDKSGSKVALEEYARQFGIELNRGKKFENMLADLEATLDV